MPQAHAPHRPNQSRLLFSSTSTRGQAAAGFPRHGPRPPCGPRGQVTAEWLMLILLSLVLLAVAAAAISRASSAQTSLAERSMLRMEAEEMGHYADEICVMGEGNARTVALAPVAFELGYDSSSKDLTISRDGWNYSRSVICAVEPDAANYTQRAYLRYQWMADAGGVERPGVRIAASP